MDLKGQGAKTRMSIVTELPWVKNSQGYGRHPTFLFKDKIRRKVFDLP